MRVIRLYTLVDPFLPRLPTPPRGSDGFAGANAPAARDPCKRAGQIFKGEAWGRGFELDGGVNCFRRLLLVMLVYHSVLDNQINRYSTHKARENPALTLEFPREVQVNAFPSTGRKCVVRSCNRGLNGRCNRRCNRQRHSGLKMQVSSRVSVVPTIQTR